MKKLFRSSLLLGLMMVATLAVACGSESDYRNALPADSFMVMSVNAASLQQKSGIASFSQIPFVSELVKQVESGSSASQQEKDELMKILNNPNELGIDFNKDIFFFFGINGASVQTTNTNGGVLLPIGDKKKFDKYMSSLLATSDAEAHSTNGLTLFEVPGSGSMYGAVAYNETALMVYFDQNRDVTATVKNLFTQKKAASIMGEAVAAEQFAKKNDINCVISYKGILPFMASTMGQNMPMLDVMKELMVTGSMNFENGEIVGIAKIVYLTKESEQKAKELYSYVESQKGVLLPYTPANSIFALGCSINGVNLLSTLSAMPGYGMMTANPLVKQAVEAFDGDMMFSFTGMTDDAKYPFASMLAQVKDPTVLSTIVANMPNLQVQTLSENNYKVNFYGIEILFGQQDGTLYITTDAMVKGALDGAKLESLTQLSSLFKDKAASFYVNFQSLAHLVSQLAAGNDGPALMASLSMLSIFDDMQLDSTTEESKVVVHMVNKEQNSFKTICDTIMELVSRYGNSQM